MPIRDFDNGGSARTAAQARAAAAQRHGGDFNPEPPSRVQTHPRHGGDFTPDLPTKAQTFPKHGGDFTPESVDEAEEISTATTMSLSTHASYQSQDKSQGSRSTSAPFPSTSKASSSPPSSFPSSSTTPNATGPGGFASPPSMYASTSRSPSVSTSATAVNSPRTPGASFKTPSNDQGQFDIPLTPLGYQKPPIPPIPNGNQFAPMHLSASRSVRSVAESSRTAVSAAPSTVPFAGQVAPTSTTYKVIPEDYTKEEREVPTHLMGGLNCCCTGLPCRAKRPHHYMKPRWEYVPASTAGVETVYYHRDHARRETIHPLTDRYLHSSDGKLRTLMVACTDDIWQAAMAKKNETTWRRTYVRKMAPYRVRLASWVIDYTKGQRNCGTYSVELLQSLCFMTVMMFVPFSGIRRPAAWRYGGDFAPVLFKYYGSAKVWNNPLEQSRGRSLPSSNQAYRTLKPRHLCFLREPERGDCVGVDIKTVQEWETAEANAGRATSLRYLFVAYSTEHFSHSNASDLRALHKIAETAARDAGIPAYWVACSCMRSPEELESDVYRISDVLRGAEAMIIAVGDPNGNVTRASDISKLLVQWGRRMWTFPEVLLSPGEEITVHARGNEGKKPFTISKSQFAAQVWGDALEARQLTEHYLGTLVLSRLELAVLGLRCLYRRETTQYLAGDQAYALMGLLRMRPEVDKTDTPFQAFSRLSIANDSDSLLERYLCMVPPSGDTAEWHYMADAYGCSAWDVAPYVQVAGVCDNDSVVLDGAYGASIRWKSFHPVGFTRLFSWRRFFAAFLLQFNGWILTIGGLSVTNPFTLFFGVLLLLIGLPTFFCMPMLIRRLMGGQFRSVEAALFGVEGYISPATAERAIFGCAYGRMGWSTNGSPLCRSYINEKNERVGVDPLRDPEVQEKVNLAKVAMPGDKRIFTLINTYTMEVTLFEAVRPPTCLFLCAVEGGMQRAIACSYDFTTQTFYRETVVRMDTTVLDRMDRVPRFRIGIRKPEVSVRRKHYL